jgi:hypothetical protein
VKEIKSERLLLKPASLEDLTTLNEIYEQVREYFSFDPSPINDITQEKCLIDGVLPPGGIKENYRIYTISEMAKS